VKQAILPAFPIAWLSVEYWQAGLPASRYPFKTQAVVFASARCCAEWRSKRVQEIAKLPCIRGRCAPESKAVHLRGN